LYVVAGGILVDVRARATPLNNTLLLAAGAILANIVGTTGASMLLIRPFMSMNSSDRDQRLRPYHILFFIFIVSNCGGCLTPIGDPPLYLGYLKGVPFSWTLTHLWPMWLLVNSTLLAVFFLLDTRAARRDPPASIIHGDAPRRGMRIAGAWGVASLVLIVACVFVDPLLKQQWGIQHLPIGAALQILIAAAAYFLTPRHIHAANQFTFAPAKEVGILFAGIFATMMPALAYLDQHAPALGLTTPTQFYFATGVLSAALDNAPTYLSFLQIASSVLGLQLTPADLDRLIHDSFLVIHPDGSRSDFVGQVMLEAISLGAVFFGAATYIGNGPNFMVKAIAEGRGVKMPSFLGYLLFAAAVLGPVLALNWLVFIR
ncbi:MAG TPA: sodium:proton antiporter, partial [Thermoanaerobaculia bacterium]|nr:sodium:proton antiporter [Thermoanaerobaculia bacterium]